jgi:hypothetical protein
VIGPASAGFCEPVKQQQLSWPTAAVESSPLIWTQLMQPFLRATAEQEQACLLSATSKLHG